MSDESSIGHDLARAFVRAAESGDIDAMRALMSTGFVGHVTTRTGGSRRVDREGYLGAIEAMDGPSAALRLDVPDVTSVSDDLVLAMVEVHAERGGRRLHNHSGQLFRIDGGEITEIWMVDALPAESDEFWAT